MAETLNQIVQKVKSNSTKKPAPEFAKQIITYEDVFLEIAKEVEPSFEVSPMVQRLMKYFYLLYQGKVSKGLFLHGSVGVGKSTIFEIISQIGLKYRIKPFIFSKRTAPGIVIDKMESVGHGYKGNFDWDFLCSKKLYIDDLGMEVRCFNQYELMKELLFERHRNQALTFVSTNMDPDQVLDRYGPQVYDRLGEMFYIVKWEGKSLRK